MENNKNTATQQLPKAKGKEGKFKFDPIALVTDEKTDKKFMQAVRKLFAFAGKKENLGKPKVKKDKVAELVNLAFEEQNKAAEAKFQKEIIQFIQDYQEFNTETKKAFEQFVKAVKENKEKLAERASKLVNDVQDLEGYIKDNSELFNTIVGGNADLGEEEVEETA